MYYHPKEKEVGWGKKQNEDNNVSGQIKHTKNRRAYEGREEARRDKNAKARSNATNQDGNKKKR